MGFLFILFFLLIVALAVFSLMLIKVVRKNDLKHELMFFQRYLAVVFALIAFTYIIFIVISAVSIGADSLIVILFIQYLIEFIYFIKILMDAKALLHNLKTDQIFIEKNSLLTRSIGESFIYLSVVEIISGLLFGAIWFVSNSTHKEFKLETNATLILYLAIGLILLIVSGILKKAVAIYNENKLTI